MEAASTYELHNLSQSNVYPEAVTNQVEDLPILLPPEAQSGAENDAEEEGIYPHGCRFLLPCFALALVLLLAGMDANIVATAVPTITDHFHTVADVGWYYSAYRLCSSTLQFIYGKLYQAFSPKYAFVVALAIFGVGSVLCAAATSSSMFVVGRAITGVGAAGVISGAFNLLRQICPLRKRPITMGVFAAVENVATIGAPILGGVLTQKLSWRWCFWINLPILGVSMIASAIFLPPDMRPKQNRTWRQLIKELDLVGNIILIPALTCLFLALSYAGTQSSWKNVKTIALFVIFGVLLIVFGTDQAIKGDTATLPPRLLKNRNVIAGFVFTCCTASATAVLEYYMPTYFQAVRGYSPSRSGYMMAPILVGTLIGVLVQGGGTTLWGYYVPFMILSSIIMPVADGLVTTWSEHTAIARLIVYSGMAGLGTGIGFLCPQTSVQTTLKKSDQSLGLAVVLFGQGFGPSVFVSVAQTIFTSQLSTNLGRLAPNLDASRIESMGLTDIKKSFHPHQLSEVIAGFHESLSQTWYLAVGLTCFSLVGSLATEWRSVKKKQT